MDESELLPMRRYFAVLPGVSISDAQREPVPWWNRQATIYHGLPEKLLKPNPRPGRYLSFLGRLSPEKRPDRAVRIARKAGMNLKIAAKADPKDKDYFDSMMKPLLRENHVEWLGEIQETEKSEFLGESFALLFPIDWPEPFGLAVIEAMACGTPVIAFRKGSAPELIEHGVTGFLDLSIHRYEQDVGIHVIRREGRIHLMVMK